LARSDVIIIIAEAMFHRRFLQVLMMEGAATTQTGAKPFEVSLCLRVVSERW